MLSAKDLVIEGVRCAVHDTDPNGNPEAVVFVHGNPGPMDDWDVLAPAVAKFARVVAMDLPGYGRADHPRKFDFTVSGYARYLGAILERQGVRRAHLVLHDFGGAFGLAWAIEHPDAFASVTLINTGILEGYRWHKFARVWQTPVLGELFQMVGNRKLFKLALDRDNPKPMPDEFVDRVLEYADWNHKLAVLALYRASRNPDAAFGAFAARARGLDRPACVIWGAEDPYLPVEFAKKQKSVFPQAEIHILPGLGHWPFIDDPELVSGLVVAYLKRQIHA